MKLARKIIRIMVGCLLLISGIFGFVLHSAAHQSAWLFVTQSALIVLGPLVPFFSSKTDFEVN